ncbi:11328_t:CDS:2 [Funneliformis caledonium]|uniref:11328_t:CDS:1 n=1 Tax=Funneliformis caledonium TaxID=1117310 RepID=A0A9N8V891_9GLOM|nr:11328_t:CDS:2 [Funneliformis caledonium]
MSKKLFFPQLSHDLTKLITDERFSDVIIETGRDDDKNSFKAHSSILYCRSPYLRKELLRNEKSDDLLRIDLNIPVKTFRALLSYMYNGLIPLDHLTIFEIYQILFASEKLGLKELVIYIRSYYLKPYHKEWLRQNFEMIYHSSFKHESFQDLQQFCISILFQNPELILKSLDSSSMTEDSLISFLKRDDLKIDVIEVWDFVIRWGISKDPRLLKDPSLWSNNDFKTFGKTLQKVLPLIRFHEMSRQQFLERIQPFQQIFDPKVYDSVMMRYCMIPSIQGELTVFPITRGILDSTLITKKHAALIDFWIRQIGKGEDLKNSILSRVKRAGTAINYEDYLGPSFGFDDITINGENFREERKCYCSKHCYEKEIRNVKDYFSLDDYEVFQIQMKV